MAEISQETARAMLAALRDADKQLTEAVVLVAWALKCGLRDVPDDFEAVVRPIYADPSADSALGVVRAALAAAEKEARDE